MQERLDKLKQWAMSKKVERKTLEKLIDKDKAKCLKKEKKIVNIDKAKEVLLFLSEQKYTNIVDLFENTITSALRDIFDDSYSFKFNFKSQKNGHVCDYHMANVDYPGYMDIRYCKGTSVKEIIALIMRIVLVKIYPHFGNIVIVDEPLGGLNDERSEIAGEFLNKISETFGIQIIMISQSDVMTKVVDNTIEVRR